jgi:hypothetical protein
MEASARCGCFETVDQRIVSDRFPASNQRALFGVQTRFRWSFGINYVTDYKIWASVSRRDVSSARRRRWSAADKGRIVAESFEHGVNASDVSHRHEMSHQQLFQWRRQARMGSLVVPLADEFVFAEVRIEPAGATPGVAGRSDGDRGRELIVGGAVVGLLRKQHGTSQTIRGDALDLMFQKILNTRRANRMVAQTLPRRPSAMPRPPALHLCSGRR